MFRSEYLGDFPPEPKSIKTLSIDDPGFRLIIRWVHAQTVPTVELGAALRDWADQVDPEHARPWPHCPCAEIKPHVPHVWFERISRTDVSCPGVPRNSNVPNQHPPGHLTDCGPTG